MFLASHLDGAVGVALALTWLGTGCSDAERGDLNESATMQHGAANAVRYRWVGGVEDTDVQAAALLGSGKVRMFFCDSGSPANATRWLELGHDGSEHLLFDDGSWKLHAHLLGHEIVGDVELGDGIARTLRAAQVDAATLAGLYEGNAACGRLGLVVTQATPDAQAMATGACTSDDGEQIQRVEPILPIASEAGSIRVRLSGTGDATLLLQPAALEPL